jgi:hypothetical protein
MLIHPKRQLKMFKTAAHVINKYLHSPSNILLSNILRIR